MKKIKKRAQETTKAGLQIYHNGGIMSNNTKRRITGLDLFNAPKRVIEYLIDTLIPIGLTIIGGLPKVGKSIFISQIVCAIAQGRQFLNKFDSLNSKILYISLEENNEDHEIRIHRIIRDSTNLDNIEYHFEWCPFDQGGLDLLRIYLEANQDVRVVIIDTLTRFVESSSKKRNQGYVNETDVAKDILKIAKDLKVSIVLIHHTVKSSKGNLNDLRGYGGFTGAADNIILLEHDKSEQLGKLLVTSRYGDSEHALKFNKDKGCWEYLGELEEFNLTPERDEILEITYQAFGPIQVKTIAKEAKRSSQGTSNLLKHLTKQGLVKCVSYGIYEITDLGKKALVMKL